MRRISQHFCFLEHNLSESERKVSNSLCGTSSQDSSSSRSNLKMSASFNSRSLSAQKLVYSLLIVSLPPCLIAYNSNLDCLELNHSIVRRREWGSSTGSTEHLISFRTRPRHVFIHHTWHQNFSQEPVRCDGFHSCSRYLRQLQEYEQTIKNWPDISYNFFIAPHGTIYEGVGWTKWGFHTLNYNNDSLGVALVGHYERSGPSLSAQLTLEKFLRCAVELNYLKTDYLLHGHRDARCTICPGAAAYRLIQRMPHFQAGPLVGYSCALSEQQRVERRSVGPDMEVESGREENEIFYRQSQSWQTGAISKGSSDKLVLMSAPSISLSSQQTEPAGAQQTLQPSFYLLTTKAKTTPTILFTGSLPSPSQGEGGSHGSSGGTGSAGGSSGSGAANSGGSISGGGSTGAGASSNTSGSNISSSGSSRGGNSSAKDDSNASGSGSSSSSRGSSGSGSRAGSGSSSGSNSNLSASSGASSEDGAGSSGSSRGGSTSLSSTSSNESIYSGRTPDRPAGGTRRAYQRSQS